MAKYDVGHFIDKMPTTGKSEKEPAKAKPGRDADPVDGDDENDEEKTECTYLDGEQMEALQKGEEIDHPTLGKIGYKPMDNENEEETEEE